MKKSEFISGFKEFLEGGLDEEAKGRFRLAVTAYFKAITQLCDLVVLNKMGYAPRTHEERFRTLEKVLPEMYSVVDELFFLYRKTYSAPLDKDSCRVIRNGIKKLVSYAKLGEEFEAFLEKL
jgi:hypothetical protein